MKKAMLFFAAFLFSVGAHAASMDLSFVSGTGNGVVTSPSPGNALFGTTTSAFANGAVINDVWSINVTEASYWDFTITANSNTGPSPSPFAAAIGIHPVLAAATDPVFALLNESTLVLSLFLDVGQYYLKINGESNHTFTGYDVAINAVPVPAALLLFAPALLGLIGLRRKAMAKAI